MSKLKVLCFGVSMDGYGAGPDQSLENPLGVGGPSLHQWFFPTQAFQKMHSEMLGSPGEEGSTGIDNDFALKGFENIGAEIMGRNMFGPQRGPWEDHSWKGWWGDNPPYHTPVFVLTNHPRPSIEMEGGTTFHFVDEGIEAALRMAKEASNGKDIRLGGGVQTVRQYLSAKLIDEMHFAISPTILGSGESLWTGLDLNELGYEVKQSVPSEKVMHVVIGRKS